MSNKVEFVFDIDIAEDILSAKEQLVKILNEKSKWDGQMINKAHIICTKLDLDATKEEEVRIEREKKDKK